MIFRAMQDKGLRRHGPSTWTSSVGQQLFQLSRWRHKRRPGHCTISYYPRQCGWRRRRRRTTRKTFQSAVGLPGWCPPLFHNDWQCFCRRACYPLFLSVSPSRL